MRHVNPVLVVVFLLIFAAVAGGRAYLRPHRFANARGALAAAGIKPWREPGAGDRVVRLTRRENRLNSPWRSPGEEAFSIEIAAIDSSEVKETLRNRSWQGGTMSTTETRNLAQLGNSIDVLTDVTIGDEDVTIAGRTFHCKVVSGAFGAGTMKVWYSAEVPLDGSVRSVLTLPPDPTREDPQTREVEFRHTVELVGFVRAGTAWGKTLDELALQGPQNPAK